MKLPKNFDYKYLLIYSIFLIIFGYLFGFLLFPKFLRHTIKTVRILVDGATDAHKFQMIKFTFFFTCHFHVKKIQIFQINLRVQIIVWPYKIYRGAKNDNDFLCMQNMKKKFSNHFEIFSSTKLLISVYTIFFPNKSSKLRSKNPPSIINLIVFKRIYN